MVRDDQGKFPDYPSDDEGGSASIFHPERLRDGLRPLSSPVQDSEDDDASVRGRGGEEDGAGGGPGDERKAGGGKGGRGGGKGRRAYDEKGAGGDKKGGKDLEDEEESGFTLRPSDFVKQLRKGQKNFEGEVERELPSNRPHNPYIHNNPHVGKGRKATPNVAVVVVFFFFRSPPLTKKYGSRRRGFTWRDWSRGRARTCRT